MINDSSQRQLPKTVPMRNVLSDNLGDFVAIYDEDVELVSVKRPEADTFVSAAERLMTSRHGVQAQWTQAANDTGAAERALGAAFDAGARALLSAEISTACVLLSELLECERVGVRMETLRAPMCPRFHVDQVPCRMLVTLAGPGTEWIASDHVDRDAFADLGSDAPPLQSDGEIRQLASGYWSLLKGGAWDGAFGGVVHRSPHAEGQRLLLSLDPIF